MSTPEEKNQPSLFKFFKVQRKVPTEQQLVDQENHKDANLLGVDEDRTKKRGVSPPATPPPISTKKRRLTTSAKDEISKAPVSKGPSRLRNKTALFDSEESDDGEEQRDVSEKQVATEPLEASKSVKESPLSRSPASVVLSQQDTVTSKKSRKSVDTRPARRSTLPSSNDAASMGDIDADTLWQLDTLETGGSQSLLEKEETMADEDEDTARLTALQYQGSGHELEVKLEGSTQEQALEMLDVEIKMDSTQDEMKAMNYFLYQCPVAHGALALYWRAFVEAYYAYKGIYCFPTWINPDLMRDQKGRTVRDQDFDLSHIKAPLAQRDAPKDEKLHFTPALTQYWEVKRDYFDKILFFKLGKFYEMFYTDACIMQGLCDLKWMGHDEKAHVGFPESSLHTYAQRAVNAGFSVTVVEQMETPHDLKERQSAEETGNKPKAVKREICEVYSQGTIAHHDMIGPEANYLACLFFHSQLDSGDGEIGPPTTKDTHWAAASVIKADSMKNYTASFSCVLVDVASSRICYINQLDEMPGRPGLRALMAHVTPREILLHRHQLPEDLIAVLSTLPQKPSITYAPASATTSAVLATDKLRGHFIVEGTNVGDSSKGAALLLEVCSFVPTLRLALLECCEYLQSLFLKERVIAFSRMEPYMANESSKHMCLDAAAMRALEVLVSGSGKEEDTLLYNMDQCKASFGSRLLRRWLTAPLASCDVINERLDVVEWLTENMDLTRELRENMSKLPDLERMTSRVSSQAIQVQRGAVYFSDTAQKKLKQFVSLLDSFVQAQDCASCYETYVIELGESPPCSRLRDLLTWQKNGGLFPNLTEQVEAIKELLHHDESDQIVPVPGMFSEYDAVIDEIKEADAALREYAQGCLWTDELQMNIPKSDLGNIRFVDIKFKYELEVPERIWKDVVKKKRDEGADVWMTSCHKTVVRFQTAEIKARAYQLSVLESKKQTLMYPFLQKIYKAFHDRSDFFIAAMSILAEVDVYCNFAHTASTWGYGPYTRPILNTQSSASSSIKVIKGYHPVVCKRINYVPNDFNLGNESEPCKTIVITGPNMGGKSTLARQVALLSIMAQVGSFVPASTFELTPLDRIFTRVGAYDSILEGKSTFYVELEEVDSFLKHATSRSLGIIDEFGRGTSIEEGAALALATVRYVAEHIKCLCLFSTHFQHQFERHLLNQNSLIAFYHMASTADEDAKKVIFLYKFLKGLCPKSHGLKVARLAGVPADVMDDADAVLEKVVANQQTKVESC